MQFLQPASGLKRICFLVNGSWWFLEALRCAAASVTGRDDRRGLSMRVRNSSDLVRVRTGDSCACYLFC